MAVGLGQRADLLPALAGQLDALLLVVVLVVVVLVELVDDRGGPLVAFHRQLLFVGGQGADDQRRAGFVDEDAVGLVDQGEVGLSLDRLLAAGPLPLAEHPAEDVGLPFADPPQQQPVAEEIEAELLGRAVDHVAGVVLAALGLAHRGLDHAHLDAQGFVDGPHPFGVATGEVVVDRGQVAALARQRVEIHRQRGGRASCLRRSASRRPSGGTWRCRRGSARRSAAC